MNKRAFLEGFFTASTVAFGGQYMWQKINQRDPLLSAALPGNSSALDSGSGIPQGFSFTAIEIETALPQTGLPLPAPSPAPASTDEPIKGSDIAHLDDQQVDSYLRKIRNFDAIFASDIYLDPRYEDLLLRTTHRLSRVESYIGHGNFNLMSFDEMLRSGRDFPTIGAFQADELNFLEEVFFANPSRYGFFGKKISNEITDFVPRADVAKISNTGHFLFRGESLNLYTQIKNDVGGDVILTSGIRSIVKQMHLFLGKAIEAQGNLSRASRSLAPPGHSYHGVGDFDIGKLGYGAKNFTAEFSGTDEYRRIAGLGYVDIRYPTDNLFGVRFEPWHIKIG